MDMYKPKANQDWQADIDAELAKSYVGKHLLFGISYLDHEESLLEQKQGHGEIIEITEEVIKVKLHGSGDIYPAAFC